MAMGELVTCLQLTFNYYEKDNYFECRYCSHGWLINQDKPGPPNWHYCPNCGYKIGDVVRIKIDLSFNH